MSFTYLVLFRKTLERWWLSTFSHRQSLLSVCSVKIKTLMIIMGVPTSFAKKISKSRKNSWKFVDIPSKQCGSPFNLTNLAKNKSNSQKTKKNRESLLTFLLSNAGLPSIWRIFSKTKISANLRFLEKTKKFTSKTCWDIPYFSKQVMNKGKMMWK